MGLLQLHRLQCNNWCYMVQRQDVPLTYTAVHCILFNLMLMMMLERVLLNISATIASLLCPKGRVSLFIQICPAGQSQPQLSKGAFLYFLSDFYK